MMSPGTVLRPAMIRSVVTRAAVAFVALALLLTSAPGFASAGHDGPGKPHCDPGGSWAAFQGFSSGSITLQTPNNALTFEVPRGSAEAVAISLTGTVQVEVAHDCVRQYTMTVVKHTQLGSSVVYTDVQHPACVGGVDVHNVPIGLDGGQYEFFLSWIGCDGTSGKDYRRRLILDPPTPDVGL